MSIYKGTQFIAGGGSGGGSEEDNVTITKNASNKIQAVGTFNKNTASGATGALYDWVGTLQEYESQNIKTLYPDWLCYITDDIAGGESVYTKAETDSLLAHKLNDNQITNCITHIPQDIKLEINASGQLVVKAGSKAYIPNGVGTFTEVTVTTDQVWTADSYNHDEVFFIKLDGTLRRQNTDMLSSGATNVMGDTPTYCHCYNTTDNKIYSTSNGGSTWTETGESLPIALVTKNNSKFVQIKQVFNGFGFMGPLVFMLPGVKMLIPNGRNADGSLKNIEWESDTVYKTNYRNWVATQDQSVQMGPSVNNIWDRYVQTEYMPTTNEYTLWYKPSENILRLNNTANSYTSEDQWTITTGGIYITNVGPGTNIDPIYYKQPGVFHALDYRNTEYMCNQATPSGVAINLTPANNTYYTAPADGWFVAIGSGTDSNMWLELISDIAQGVYGTIGWQYKVSLAVKRGASCLLNFSNINFSIFKFVYANGAIGWK